MKVILLILVLSRVILLSRGFSRGWWASRCSRAVFCMPGYDVITIVSGWYTRGVFRLIRSSIPTVGGWRRCEPSVQRLIGAQRFSFKAVVAVKRASVWSRWKPKPSLSAARTRLRRRGYLRVVFGRTRVIGSVFVLYRRHSLHWWWRQGSVAQSQPRSLLHFIKVRRRWWRWSAASGKRL